MCQTIDISSTTDVSGQTNLNRNKPCFSSSELCNVARVNDGGPQQLQGERPVRETEFSLKINEN